MTRDGRAPNSERSTLSKGTEETELLAATGVTHLTPEPNVTIATPSKSHSAMPVADSAATSHETCELPASSPWR